MSALSTSKGPMRARLHTQLGQEATKRRRPFPQLLIGQFPGLASHHWVTHGDAVSWVPITKARRQSSLGCDYTLEDAAKSDPQLLACLFA